MSKLFFWPTVLMPHLLAIRQSRNLFNFGQYKLFIDYIFHVLHTKFVFKERNVEKLLHNIFLCFSSNHIDPDGGCPE